MSARVIKRKMKGGASEDELSEMFNQMLGTGSVNIEIAYPRYVHLKDLTESIEKLIKAIANTPYVREGQPSIRDEFASFLAGIAEARELYFGCDLSDHMWNFASMDDGLYKKFCESYTAFKSSGIMNQFVMICDRLIMHRGDLSGDNPRPDFIFNMPGVDWCPLVFTKLNLKHVCAIEGYTQKFFMKALSKMLELTLAVYNEVTSPDVDVDKFADIIIKSMDQLRHQPGISRCDKAFAKIRDSIHLLKNNFNNYYRDFLSAGDSTIIMQHFILDVSNNTDADAQTIQQFRQIIRHYQKMASQQVKNPKLKAMFDRANECFKQMERNAPNLARKAGAADSESSASSDPADDSGGCCDTQSNAHGGAQSNAHGVVQSAASSE